MQQSKGENVPKTAIVQNVVIFKSKCVYVSRGLMNKTNAREVLQKKEGVLASRVIFCIIAPVYMKLNTLV